jgi:hypothetical protein
MGGPRMMSRVQFLAAVLAATSVVVVTAKPASAGIWAWGCMGKLGNERVVFDRNTMIVTASKLPSVKLEQLGSSGSKLETEDGMTFNNLGSSDGFEKSMSFEINDTSERKLTLIETSSHKTFTRKGRVGKREETTTKFQKTFRYAFDKEPERTIKMQCIEYVLTTCGGPCS